MVRLVIWDAIALIMTSHEDVKEAVSDQNELTHTVSSFDCEQVHWGLQLRQRCQFVSHKQEMSQFSSNTAL